MIKRSDIRNKIADLLNDPEYKRHYYDSQGHITGAQESNGEISSDAIDGLLNGYFNDQVYQESKNATIVVVETPSGKYYNEIPSQEDLQTAIEAGFDPSIITDPDTPYDPNVHGPPTGSGVQPMSFTVKSKGDFFGDLNTFALVSAAVYELLKEDLEQLKQALRDLGINIP